MKKIDSLTDEEVVELVRQKDKEQYAVIIKRYQDKLVRYSTNLIGDSDKAEDCVQNAFIKAYVNLQGFNTKKKFSSWIYRIVHNESINCIKKYKKEISLEKNSWVKFKFFSKDDVEEDFSKKEAVEMLKSNLKKLPVNYRSALTLYYLEDRTYEEIAEVLKAPIGTVGTWMGRGKKMLKEII